jgi:hypothetical protein
MKYFFHMEDGACIRDSQGEEFSDDAAALREAVNVARGLAKEGLHHQDHWRVVVKDANGLRIGTVPLAPSYDEPAAEIAVKH